MIQAVLMAQNFQVPDNLPYMALGMIALIIFALVMLVVIYFYGGLWFQAYMSDARVTIWSLIGMSLRQGPTPG